MLPSIARYLMLLLTLPIFIYGFINNALMYFVPVRLVRGIKDKQFHSSVKAGLSILVTVPLTYGIQTLLVGFFTPESRINDNLAPLISSGTIMRLLTNLNLTFAYSSPSGKSKPWAVPLNGTHNNRANIKGKINRKLLIFSLMSLKVTKNKLSLRII